MKKKKLIALLCSFVMLTASLVGCAQDAKTQSTEGAKDTVESKTEESAVKTEESVAEPEEELEYVELDWVVYVQGKSNDIDMIREKLEEYFLEKLNCKVNLINLASTYMDTISTSLLSGEEMDLVQILGQDYNGLAKQGVFYPMDELWEYGPNVKGLFTDDVWNCMTVDGHVYAAPVLRDNAYIMGVVYNNTLASNLGYDMESETKDWNSMMDVAEFALEAIKVRDEKYPEYAGSPIMTRYTDAVPYCFAFEQIVGNLAGCNVAGLEVDTTQGKDTVFNFYETEAYKEFVLMQQRLVESGAVDPERTKMVSEEYGLFNAGWGYTWINDDLYGGGYETKLKVFEDALWTDAGSFTIASTAIAASSKNPERAMMVLDLLETDPYLATLCRFGVEGEHWEYDADGNMQMTGRNADPSNLGWLSWYGIYHPNVHITVAPESYSGPDNVMLTKMNEYVADSTVATHMGFVFNTDPVINEIAACNNVLAEYKGLDKGEYGTEEATLEALDAMNDKLKANGVDKIIAEVQAQLDAFVAAN